MHSDYSFYSLKYTFLGYVIDISFIVDLRNCAGAMRPTKSITLFQILIINPMSIACSITWADALRHIHSLFERKRSLCPGCLPGA